MDIGCACICSYDNEPAEFSSTKYVKARKEHPCCECGETITVGERYEYVFGKWDGYLDTYRTCMTCVNIRRDVCCNSWTFTTLREDIWEVYGVDYVTGETIDDDE